MDTGWIWSLVTIGGPILLGVVLIWAILNNRRSPAEEERTERATARLYEEQDRIDKANEGAAKPRPDAGPAPSPPSARDSEPPKENISTRPQAPGDAMRPRDTLDRDIPS